MGITTPDIPDDWLITKFGRSKRSQEKRCDKHLSQFGRIRNADIRFHRAIWTDPHLESACETAIKTYFFSRKQWVFGTSGTEILARGKFRQAKPYKEVFAIPPAALENIILLFDAWQAQFGGGYEDLLRSNTELREAQSNKGAKC